MKNFTTKVNALALKGTIKAMELKDKAGRILTQQSGEGFVDTALVRHVSN